jgi:aromatic-L-amino-acid decarboxylase
VTAGRAVSSRVAPPFPADTSLELSAPEMERLVRAATDRIVDHVASLPAQPAADTDGAEALARELIEREPPETGAPAEELLDLLFTRAIPKSFNTASPGYLAYIPGGGIFHSALADLIAGSVNRYVGVWAAAPALAQLEAAVVRWFADLIGYPPEARGVLTTGGSMANFTALVAARRDRLPENFLNGIIYASDQVHHSVTKAAILAGFPEASVREIGSNREYRIELESLKRAIHEDRSRGLAPFMLVASAGTTNTGAVDNLEALADVARAEKLWLHVDAAYGGFFLLTERGKRTMRGIERSDSVTLDPHKALFLSYGTGSLVVRDGEALRRAHAVHANYLPPMQEDADLVDFCLYSPELSRAFRGLRIWLPMNMHGAGAFRRNLDEKLDLAQWATSQLRRIDGIEIIAEPQLTVVAFRLFRAGLAEDELNLINRRLLDRINARKRVFLTSTSLAGRFVIRICVLSFRTHMDRMEAALEDIHAAVEELS